MAFDGGFLHTVVSQLEQAVFCHVDKIYQPSRNELVLLLRKKGFAKRLLLSAANSAARIQFTDGRYENPETPPMFCMLVRKIFSSSKLVEIKQIGLERVVELCFETTNEMGDRIKPKIVCELIGNSANIILVGENGKIYDAIHRNDIETSSRIIQPGAVYEYPASQNKLNILQSSSQTLVEKILGCGDIPLSSAILRLAEGVSPLVCREIAHRAYGEDLLISQIKDSFPLLEQIEFVINCIKKPTLSVLYKPDGTPFDYCYMNIAQYGSLYTLKCFDNPSNLLDGFYFEREAAARIARQSADITRLVSTLTARAMRRKLNRERELDATRTRENLRISGELIKANIHTIPTGATVARVQNFYDENMAFIEIPLDTTLTASANAAKYFKEYKKSCAAVQSLTTLIESDRAEIEYLESVAESLERCRTSADITEIREELALGGYLKQSSLKKQRKKVGFSLEEHTSVEGFKIVVGKNNMQNDYITTTLATKGDMWFHTKNIHGSHVVVMCSGATVSDETILFAARLAAKNSRAAQSSNVPVDYTRIKYVKKPAGAKAGMVVYTTNKTVFVTP